MSGAWCRLMYSCEIFKKKLPCCAPLSHHFSPSRTSSDFYYAAVTMHWRVLGLVRSAGRVLDNAGGATSNGR